MARKGVKGKATKKNVSETLTANNGIGKDETDELVEQDESVPVSSKRGRKAKAEITVVKETTVDEKSVEDTISNKRKAGDNLLGESTVTNKQAKLKLATNGNKNGSEHETISSNNTDSGETVTKNPATIKRGRKKIDALNEIAIPEELNSIDSKQILVQKNLEKNSTVSKKGRKKPAEKEILENENNEGEKNSDEAQFEKNQNSEPSSKTTNKRGKKKVEENLPDKTEENNSKVKENVITVTDVKVADAPSVRGRQRKKNELLNIEGANVQESNLKNVPKRGKKGLEKSSPVAMNMKDCFVALNRDENLDILSDVKESSHEKVKNKPKTKAIPDESNKIAKGKKNKKVDDNNEGPSKPAKVPKKNEKTSGKANIAKTPDIKALNFDNKATSPSGKPWNIKISSWNVNGIRAWIEKDGISYIHHEKPDIITLQETKCSDDKLPEDIKKVENYHTYWLSGDKDGYSGIGLLTKEKPIEVKYGIDMDQHDTEGRVITAEYECFFLVAAYVPNAGKGLVRLDYRTGWDKDFCMYLKKLDEKKAVILCGDLNVAHEEIDLANPKSNKKSAGFTQEEREGFSSLLKEGFIDTFRHLYPDTKSAYTFWTYMMSARAKNVGWRLDYFVISKRFVDNLCDSVIRKDVYGSDHCPITLFLAV